MQFLALPREMRALGSERVWRGRGSEESVLLEKAGQRNPPHPAGGGVEKRASSEFQLGLNVDIVSMMHNYSRVINSSRLRAVRATATQAAASGVATPSGRYLPISFFHSRDVRAVVGAAVLQQVNESRSLGISRALSRCRDAAPAACVDRR